MTFHCILQVFWITRSQHGQNPLSLPKVHVELGKAGWLKHLRTSSFCVLISIQVCWHVPSTGVNSSFLKFKLLSFLQLVMTCTSVSHTKFQYWSSRFIWSIVFTSKRPDWARCFKLRKLGIQLIQDPDCINLSVLSPSRSILWSTYNPKQIFGSLIPTVRVL